MTDDILKIIDETFDECISVNAFETILGIENEIEGKEDFRKYLKEKINAYLKSKTVTILQVCDKHSDFSYVDSVYYDDKEALKITKERQLKGEIISPLKTKVK